MYIIFDEKYYILWYLLDCGIEGIKVIDDYK